MKAHNELTRTLFEFELFLVYICLPFPVCNWGGNVAYAATCHAAALRWERA